MLKIRHEPSGLGILAIRASFGMYMCTGTCKEKLVFFTERVMNQDLPKLLQNATEKASSTKWRASRANFASLFVIFGK